MRYLRAIGAFAVVASLAVPVAASAHPSVYTDATAIGDSDTDPGEYTPDPHTRHVVSNHGFTYVLRESNGVGDDFGVMTYSRLPGDYRSGIPVSQVLSEGSTAAQAHATCRGVPELETVAAITGWQEGDPFYNYVPFQTTSAGLEDNPGDWLDNVEALTGVDLTEIADPAQACANLSGTYAQADRMQTPAANLASGTVAEATAPLQAQIASLRSSLTAAEQARNAAQAALAAANTELARVMPLTRAFAVALPAARMRASALRSDGATVTLTGPPLQAVSLRLTMPAKAAKKIGLKSGLLARRTASIGAGGSAQATLRPNAAVRRALQRLRGSAKLTLAAAGGDRADSVTGRVAR